MSKVVKGPLRYSIKAMIGPSKFILEVKFGRVPVCYQLHKAAVNDDS